MVWKLSRDFICFEIIFGDGCFISRTYTHTTLNMAKSTEQKFERDWKNSLLSLDFDEVSKIFIKEGMMESFVQDATTKVSVLQWLVHASSSQE